MSEIKTGYRLRVHVVKDGNVSFTFDGDIGTILGENEQYKIIYLHEKKCGKMLQPSQTTVMTCTLTPGHSGSCSCLFSPPGDERWDERLRHIVVFRSGEGWMPTERQQTKPRRKQSTDHRYAALCALEAGQNSTFVGSAMASLRAELRSGNKILGSLGMGRNPKSAPRRKDDRR